MNDIWLLSVFLLTSTSVLSHDAKDFDDSVLYSMDWTSSETKIKDIDSLESVLVTFEDQNKYTCLIPKINKQEVVSKNDLDLTTSPLTLLSSIFSSTACNYRIEAYWTYEICHGHFVKQFHEDRDGKIVKLQEYYLGKWSEEQTEKLSIEMDQARNSKERKWNTIKIENVNFPYFEMDMSDGTHCELSNAPRSIKVKYVCFANKNSEIYTIKETSTCNYEMIVLTSKLCSLPAFTTEKSEETPIHCSPVGDAPPVPFSYWMNRWENYKSLQERLLYSSISLGFSTFIENVGNFFVLDKQNEISTLSTEKTPSIKLPQLTTSARDLSPIKDFLSSSSCLTGGSGWWKYEFCFGNYVRQIHYEKNNEETSVNLGYYNQESHLKWLAEHPEKKPKSKELRTEVSYFYDGGDICDKTNEKRKTEVKLKCLKNGASSTAVSMYLLEPKTCEYTLVVEASLICDILPLVNDEDGEVPAGVLKKKFGLSNGEEITSTNQIHIEF